MLISTGVFGKPAAFQLVGGLPDELAGKRVGVCIPEIRAIGSGNVAVLLAARGGKARFQRLGDGYIHRQEAIVEMIGAAPATCRGAELITEIGGRDQKHTTEKKTPKQETKKTTKDQNESEDTQVHPAADGRADINIIDV